ncbi:replication initiation protein [uncultured Tenacibaculum sp.]|uniref:replication initiation protein n=1 Tax=uncultured Tenacibaculum sp. TaxID=174713 RepID=UPI00260351D1|nr:replication initiation protein [uncultured Tenacibaculum sp.]
MKNNVTIYQDNKITQSRYEFSVIEKRIIYQIINQIRKNYVLNGTDNNLFGDLVLNLNYAMLKEVSENTDLVYKALRRLISKFYEFNNDNQWMIVSIINKAKHKKKEALWEITVDSDMVAKFVELAKNYTAYSLVVAMSLRSEHSQRLYEYCSQFKSAGGWRTTIKDLRHKMKLENKYSRYASFKKRVLDVAKNELKKMYKEGSSDLYFEYSEQKNGRSVDSLTFKIIHKENIEVTSLQDLDYIVRTDLHQIFDTYKKPKNKEFITETMSVLRLEPEHLKKMYGKIAFVKSSIPKNEWQRYLRFVIKEDVLKTDLDEL